VIVGRSTYSVCVSIFTPDGRRKSQNTNIPIPAANMTAVVIPTTSRDSRELGWLRIKRWSEATMRIATRRKGARSPFNTALQ
jgi:hypothetical protein